MVFIFESTSFLIIESKYSSVDKTDETMYCHALGDYESKSREKETTNFE